LTSHFPSIYQMRLPFCSWKDLLFLVAFP